MTQSKIHRFITSDGSARLIFADTTEIVQKAMDIHKPSQTAAAALGRALTATSIMGSLMKNETDLLTLQIKGDGPLGTVVCVSDYLGNVKGYAENPSADAPRKPNGKLAVGDIVGNGTMYVIRDLGTGEPYIGMCELVSGEIAEDVTEYFARSEQTPSVCALGVLVTGEKYCICSGGFIIQVLPGAYNETIDIIEKNIGQFTSVTSLMKNGKTADEFAAMLFSGIEYEKFDEIDIGFNCNCSKEKYEKGIISLGRKEIQDMIDDGKTVETRCGFCNSRYEFTIQELEEMLKNTKI